MANTTFTDFATPIVADWLNDVNDIVYERYADVKLFGALGDGATDDTAAFNAAAATGLPLHMPDGLYRLTNTVTLQNGQILQGAGRTRSIFVVDSGFNLAASGVIRLGTSEPGAIIRDVGFIFIQPDTAIRANVIAYPPAIDASNCPRSIIDNIRVSGGYDGINATGNAGGSYIGFVEIGALRNGITIDGSLDFFHGGHWHFWPFGFGGSILNGVYYDGVGEACVIGRVDGFDVDSISTFRTKVRFTTAAGVAIPYKLKNLELDGDGARLTVEAGVIDIAASYSTKSGAAVGDTITATGGSCNLNFHSCFASQPGREFYANGGALSVNGGRTAMFNAAGQLGRCDAGALTLRNLDVAPAALAYILAHVQQAGAAILTVVGCKWPGRGIGTGTAVAVNTDNTRAFVSGNDFADWNFSPPAAFGLGTYGPNRVALLSYTPSVSFTTNGNFVPTYTVREGNYKFENGGIWFRVRLLFNTNAYTTAAGALQVSLPVTGLNIVNPVNISRMANITLTGGYSMITAGVDPSSNQVLFFQSGSGVALAGMGTGNFPASTNNIEFVISGFLPNF